MESATANNGGRPWAAVTGASSGIGLELARQFAEHDYNLVIASENDAIHQAAAELRREGSEVRAVRVDLATPDGVERLVAEIDGLDAPLDSVAINAGIGV